MSILKLITEDCIKVPLESTNKNDILRELIGILKNADKIEDEVAVYSAVRSREDQCSTGLGGGIAIPHAKIAGPDQLSMAVGVAPEGVNFESLDGQPVTVFFLIITPSDKDSQHIEALTEVARITRSADFMQSLISSGTAAEVLKLLQE